MTGLNPSCRIDSLDTHNDFLATVHVLRLDLLHPVISGNKWFKLQNYLRKAKEEQKTLLTFGGAFSNHIVAMAAAAKGAGLQSIGVIRGEAAPVLSHTLLQAQTYGMKLFFTSRERYRNMTVPDEVLYDHTEKSLCIVPEGGCGENGVNGARDILLKNDTSGYTHILTAVGTGTTLAGLTAAAGANQKVIGISVLKKAYSLAEDIRGMLPAEKANGFDLLHAYHFGGYARKTPELIYFMNDLFARTAIPTDFVYTGKTFYATFDLLRSGFFSAGDRILVIHTGGLQGNLSLPKGTLIFA